MVFFRNSEKWSFFGNLLLKMRFVMTCISIIYSLAQG